MPDTVLDRLQRAEKQRDAAEAKAKLLPGENMVVTVARRMIERGENPQIDMTTALLVTIERLTGGDPHGDDDG